MRLKRLELYGFKSFAERTEIAFEPGITGIVGPNGCGKSNISDAVRWALGEQNARQLRGGKMEDVIFNGSENRKPLAWCEVSVVFDNQDRALAADAAEIAVTRRVYRSGASEALINRAPCRLKDITELFRDTGVGKEGYSLISQGRIDEILSARPEERRAVFEEAAGIMTYRARKHDAERRIENARQNLTRVRDLIDAMEERLIPLESQSRDARAYLVLAEKLRLLELNRFLADEERAAARIDSLNQTIAACRDESEMMAQKLSLIESERRRLNQRAAELEEQSARLRETRLSDSRAYERLDGEIGLLRERAEHARTDASRAEALRSECESSITELDRAADDQSSLIERKQDSLERLTEALTASTDALNAARAEEERCAEALESHKSRTMEALNRQSDTRAARARLTTMRQTLLERIDQSQAEQSTLESRRVTLESDLEAARSDGVAAEDALIKLGGRRESLERALARDKQAADDLDRRIRAARDAARQQETRLSMLRELADAYEGYQHAVKHVLMKKDGAVRGVVANLISVPKEYETAIEQALGGALQHIVTDDETAAKRLIEFLRGNRYGRATFLPVTTVRGRTLSLNERGALNTPGCLGAASELIMFDDEYKGIVDSLLGRTALARDMDAGLAVMRRAGYAFRTVTLAGDILNPGGSMTGGSVATRGASLLSRGREMDACAESIAVARAALGELAEQAKTLEAERAARASQLEAAARETRSIEIDAVRLRSLISAARDALAVLAEQAGESARRLDAARDNLADVDRQLAAAEASQSAETVDQKALTEEMLILQARRTRAREAAESAQERSSSDRASHAALSREIESARREHARIIAERAERQDRAREAERERELAVRQSIRADAEREDRERQREELSRRLDSIKDRLAELDAAAKDTRAGTEANAADADAVRVQSGQSTERAHRAQTQLARVEEERKARADRIWNAYELTAAGAEEARDPLFDYSRGSVEIDRIKGEIRALGAVNVRAVEEYQELSEKLDGMRAQRDDLERARLDLESVAASLLDAMNKRFVERLAVLNRYFGETFARLFGGGNASLSLADERNPLECGIDILAQPPGKKTQLLSLLSGGERALTAIAILFAIMTLKPSPFCILDEIDSALDESNVAQFARALEGYARDTQFVVVTHRRGTMERCPALYGVAMGERGVSRMVSVRLEDAIA
ncbi:MAG: chromosome segregation protein SMC [Oscillospiraceae bacterium]|nr:chromosome segregation protein SMC [Oscillospiraceae bacterium]